ncbi:unnamed protein product [Arabidopsis halleri]
MALGFYRVEGTHYWLFLGLVYPFSCQFYLSLPLISSSNEPLAIFSTTKFLGQLASSVSLCSLV